MWILNTLHQKYQYISGNIVYLHMCLGNVDSNVYSGYLSTVKVEERITGNIFLFILILFLQLIYLEQTSIYWTMKQSQTKFLKYQCSLTKFVYDVLEKCQHKNSSLKENSERHALTLLNETEQLVCILHQNFYC